MKQRTARMTQDELLSAYLDGELTAEEREHLEARLLTDPALQRRLDTLHRTVALVHDLPQAPLPRNFILSPGMLSSPSPTAPTVPKVRRRVLPPWIAPSLTVATTIVAMLFAIVLVNSIRFSHLPMATAPQTVEYDMPEKAITTVVVEELAVEHEAEQEATDDEQAQSLGSESTPPPPALSPTLGAGMDSGPSFSSSPAPLVAGAAIATSTATARYETMPPIATAPPVTEVVTEGGIAAIEEETEETFREQPEGPSPSPAALLTLPEEEPVTETAVAFPGPSPWRVWAIGLGILTLILIVASVLAWRARQAGTEE